MLSKLKILAVFKGVVLFLAPNIIYAQESFKRTALYLELGGQGIGISANVDYRLFPIFSVRMGYWTGLNFAPNAHGPIVAVSFLTHPEKAHHIEAGLGAALDVPKYNAYRRGTPEGVPVIPSALLGYRYQPRNGGMMFRVAFTPVVVFGWALFLPVPVVVPWAGVSVGYVF